MGGLRVLRANSTMLGQPSGMVSVNNALQCALFEDEETVVTHLLPYANEDEDQRGIERGHPMARAMC